MSSIREHARVTINFHPDRVLPTGLTVVEGLLREGKYLSQFETHVIPMVVARHILVGTATFGNECSSGVRIMHPTYGTMSDPNTALLTS